ncbi:MAG: PAS domain-containing sensor histidine kinase [Blastocatellia bacterium]|nr:PAS domain-containing sensor histidine kinase [Blastocatellia bacterium]
MIVVERAGRQKQVSSQNISYETRILLFALCSALPAVIISLLFLWNGSFTPKVEWTLTSLIVLFWLLFSYTVQRKIVTPLQTISNLLAALREEDYSIRARVDRRNDALGEVLFEVNALSDLLREQRLGALEATALLRTVMTEIEVAVFAFDQQQKLKLINRAGEKLLAQPAERLMGLSAAEIGLGSCINNGESYVLDMAFPGGTGRWSIRTRGFREKGSAHQLLVLSDMSRELREQERDAWQKLVRVLGHELNNSLAPIKSIAGSLESIVTKQSEDWQEDVKSGLAVIAGRADALSRFTQAYTRLARLPQPQLKKVILSELVRRVIGFETRIKVELISAEEVELLADADQLEQLLINLIKNGVEAVMEIDGGVKVGWRLLKDRVEIYVEDEGLGISNPSNLFVPFFTTKPQGSGIGLVLSRQIAEAHGGSLTLENRVGKRGCVATLQLPRKVEV